MEAEYMCTSHCMKEAVWLMQFLVDMRYMHKGPKSTMCDNQG